jgi:low temperature requirement protein LtrA
VQPEPVPGLPRGGGDVKRVAPLELFFDLVFVFALTQVTALMANDEGWSGLGRGMLALAAIWWAWAAYAWLTNEVDPRRTGVRLAVCAAMVAMLLAALALPRAFGDEALLFACSYLGVRVVHVGLFAAGSDSDDVRGAVRALTPPAVAAPAALVGAAFLEGWAQAAVWIAVLAFDYVTGGTRGIGGWRLSPGHFAERHGLVVIIVLGESIVSIGVGLADAPLGAGELVAAALGVVIAATMWWIYFEHAAEDGEAALQRARPGLERNVLARDIYSYLHLVMAAGIVLLALGIKQSVAHVEEPFRAVDALAACGGTALYLLGHVAFRIRTEGTRDGRLVAAAVACLLLVAPALVIASAWTLAALAAAGVALIATQHAQRATQARERPSR